MTFSPPDARDPANAEPIQCPAATVTVATSQELQTALDGAEPGDSISLADGVFTGQFVISRSGTAEQPIYLCGGESAVIDGRQIDEGYAVHLDKVRYWRLSGFTVRNAQKAVMADATSGSVIHGLTIHDIGDEAIHLRSASTYNVIIDNTVRRTGLRRDKYGEGVYIGSAESNWETHSSGEPDRSDFNIVARNDIADTGSESIDIKEGTTGGWVFGNLLDGTGMSGADSVIDVKGNGWLVEANIGDNADEGFQTHRVVDGWGTDNIFRANVIDVRGDGYHIYIHKPKNTSNVVECSNRTGSGADLRSNVECHS